MNGKRQPAYAPEFRQQIVELYASGRGPGELAKEFGCSEASVHAWVKKAGTLRSLPDAGSTVKKVHRQAHRVQVAMALSAEIRPTHQAALTPSERWQGCLMFLPVVTTTGVIVSRPRKR